MTDFRDIVVTGGCLVAAAVLSGCGGGGGGGGSGGKLATVDQAWAQKAVADVADRVPGCEGDQARAASALRSGISQLSELVKIVSIQPNDEEMRQKRVLKNYQISGQCGGVVHVDSEHANGNTDYSLDFQQYCVDAEGGPSRLQGEIESTEVGNPTNSGPRISEVRTSVPGLEVAYGSDTTVITVDGYKTQFGVPATWSPGVPTESSPDKTTVKRVKIGYKSQGTTDEISNLSLERWGNSASASVEVKAGRYTIGETNEQLELGTAAGEPMQVNIDSTTWVGGALELRGADDTVMEVRPSGTRGQYVATVNGEPASDDLDCQGADAPVTHVLDLLLDQLPVY